MTLTVGDPLLGGHDRPVGRGDALAAVDDALAATEDDGGRTVLVTGEAGVGKTALLSAVARRASDRGFHVFRGAADRAALDPFGPVARAFEAAGDATGVPGYLRAPEGPTPTGYDAFSAQRSAQFHDVADELRAMATVDPVVVLVDDLQWADGATLALFAHFAEHIREWIYPVLVVGAARPCDHPTIDRVAGLERTRTLALDPLSAAGLGDLLAARLGTDPPAAFVDLVASATGGVPAHAAALLDHWRATGALDPAAGTYPGAVDAPDLDAAVARHVEGRPEDQRRHLESAAVLGQYVPRADLAAVAGDHDTDAVRALADAGFWRADADAVRFDSGRLREAVLATVPGERLAALHRRAADAVDDPGAAAHHAAAAGDRAAAVEGYVAAAEGARDVVAPEVAAVAYDRARAQSKEGDDPRRALELALDAGEAHRTAGAEDAAEERFRAVRERADVPELVARACRALAALHIQASDLSRAKRLADAGLAAADDPGVGAPVRRELLHAKGKAALRAGDLEAAGGAFERELAAAGDDRERAIALTDRAVAERRSGDLQEARALLTDAVDRGEASGDDQVLATALRKRAVVDNQLGDVDAAVDQYHRLIGTLQADNAATDLPTAMMNLGASYYNLGRLDRAVGRYETSVEMAERVDREVIRALALGNLGAAELDAGDLESAVTHCEEAVEVLASLDRRDRAAFRRVTLALARLLAGDDDAALSTADDAVATARETGQSYALGYALRIRGDVRRARGDLPGAVEDHEEALAVADALGNVRQQAQAGAALSADHLAAGRGDEALAAAERAFERAYELDQPLLVSTAAARLGAVRRARGDLQGAAAALDGARVTQRDCGDVRGLTRTHLALARLERARGDLAAARSYVDRAREAAADAGFERFVRAADDLARSLDDA